MNIEVSIGEIVDKLSILLIKKNNVKEETKLQNIIKEFDYLNQIVFEELKVEYSDFEKILSINESLWDIEDKLRDMERDKLFNSDFIELARSVYYTNDKRASIKKDINLKYNSNFVEEKSYKKY